MLYIFKALRARTTFRFLFPELKMTRRPSCLLGQAPSSCILDDPPRAFMVPCSLKFHVPSIFFIKRMQVTSTLFTKQTYSYDSFPSKQFKTRDYFLSNKPINISQVLLSSNLIYALFFRNNLCMQLHQFTNNQSYKLIAEYVISSQL